MKVFGCGSDSFCFTITEICHLVVGLFYDSVQSLVMTFATPSFLPAPTFLGTRMEQKGLYLRDGSRDASIYQLFLAWVFVN